MPSTMNGYIKSNSLEDVEENPVLKPAFRLNGNKYASEKDDHLTGE